MNERDILAQKDFAVKEALVKGRTEGLAEGEARGRTEGLAEGEARGEAKGRAEGKRETAKNLKAMGLSLEQIVCATGLSREDIQYL